MPNQPLTPQKIVSGQRVQRHGATGGGHGITYDEETGEEIFPEIPTKMIAWLLSWPNQEPKTVKEFCDTVEHMFRGKLKIGISEKTYYKWKNDPRFQRKLEQEARRFNITTERVQSVTNTFFEIMMDKDMKGTERLRAGELYMKYVDRFMPKIVEDDGPEISDMSDEDLEKWIEEMTRG